MLPKQTAPDATNSKALVEDALARLRVNPKDLTEARRLLASSVGKVREAAGASLANTGHSEAVALLLGAIKSEQDISVRENLVESLRHVTNPEAIPVLAEQAQDLSDLALHRVCRNAMSAMTDPLAVSQLVEMLGRGGDDAALEPIAYAVSHMTSSNAMPGLLQGATSDNERAASACIQGLGHLGTPETFLALLELAGRFEGTKRGQIAATVANQVALEKKDARFIESCLRVIETTSSPRAWQAAIDGLVAIPNAEALVVLEQQLRGESNAEIVAYIEGAIARRKSIWRTP